ELLLAGVERVAHVANAHDDHGLGGAGLNLIAAGATDFRVHIFRMNVRLHKKGRKLIRKLPDDKREFFDGVKEICGSSGCQATFDLAINAFISTFAEWNTGPLSGSRRSAASGP